MSKFERRYKSGEIIFREGDASTSAYVLVSGQVELAKNNASKPVRLSLLEPGEMFGEMGLVDNSPRSATARAVSEVVVDIVEKEDFIQAVRETPDVALTVIGNLAERLRATNELVAQPTERVAQQAPAGTRPGVWDQFRQLMEGGRKQVADLKFLIAPIHGDIGQTQSKRVSTALGAHKAVQVVAISQAPTGGPELPTAHRLGAAATEGRALLVREAANLLVWGEINETGTALNLRFISYPREDDPAGCFLISDRLPLPIGGDDQYLDLLLTAAFAAAAPRTDAERPIIRELTAKAFEVAQANAHELPVELSLADQSCMQVCYANIAALLGAAENDQNTLRRAEQIYEDMLGTFSFESTPMEWATVHRHVGVVRQMLGERSNDGAVLENAAGSFRGALQVFSPELFAWEWATIQSRLGGVLYRLDSLRSDTDLLKESIAAYQESLRVFTQSGSPFKWGEVKNGLGQALQVWGDLTRNADLLKRAVQACREALQVRTQQASPMLWAATQNNLGSALFLLGRLTESVESLEGSAEAFGKALAVYTASNANRLSKVTERNMAKAEDMLRAKMARRVARVYWEDDSQDPAREITDDDEAQNA